MTGYCMYSRHDFKGDAVGIFELFKDEPFVFFLDSGLPSQANGRFSFIGFDPFEIFYDKGRNALEALQALYDRYAFKPRNTPCRLHSGLVGYLGYDLGLHFENIQSRSKDDYFLPDCLFGFYDCVITVDHHAHKLYITSTGLPEKSDYLIKLRAQHRMENILSRLHKYADTKQYASSNQNHSAHITREIDIPLSCNFTELQYIKAVKKALDYIARGDIYQVNLSQRFMFDASRAGLDVDPVALYKTLRKLSPANFAGYFDCGGFRVISSSPERFLHLQDNILHTRPMKGTRPRGSTPRQDEHLQEELLRSKKDKAELLMITDLERNDLGRVCKYGSVRVAQMRTLEKYATVFQTTSTVQGTLRKNKNPFDCIEACFPGGSITGCPKIRSMEIIEELEPTKRALYTGSLGYISFSGEMDFNILIRTLIAKQRKIYFHVGGGIVSDSIPEKEYEETLVKAKAMRLCLADAFCKRQRVYAQK